MSVLIVTHPSSHLHVTPSGHPERVLAAAFYATVPRAEVPATSDVQIIRLRRKIEVNPKAPRYLQTVRGSGYLLTPD